MQVGGETIKAGPSVNHAALARKIQLVSQDPFSSLDPRLTVERTLREVLHVHKLHVDNPEARIEALLSMVGLAPRFRYRYPHELSGGQSPTGRDRTGARGGTRRPRAGRTNVSA